MQHFVQICACFHWRWSYYKIRYWCWTGGSDGSLDTYIDLATYLSSMSVICHLLVWMSYDRLKKGYGWYGCLKNPLNFKTKINKNFILNTFFWKISGWNFPLYQFSNSFVYFDQRKNYVRDPSLLRFAHSFPPCSVMPFYRIITTSQKR